MNKAETVQVNDISFSNENPIVVIGGINVLESTELALEVGREFVRVTQKLAMPYVFKVSYDKANRSSLSSYRGPGLEKGIEMLKAIKDKLHVPVLTDIHEPHQVESVAEVADILQIPAFLCRQTDLLSAAARTGKPIHIKKAQFLSPYDVQNIIDKVRSAGNDRIILCERGTMFGYNNLVVDMLSFPIMKNTGVPVTFDVTHSLQQPGGLGAATAGRREHLFSLMKAGVSQGLAGVFVEAHPNPSTAKCDGPCALPLSLVEEFLMQVCEIDTLVKRLPNVLVS